MSNYTEQQLVSLLQKASHAYYNEEKSIMTDDQYDSLREELERRFPHHPFLQQIGAPVGKGAIQLPYKMPSLNKIKPETGQVALFAGQISSNKGWVLSEKLDGISVLWMSKEKKLYLRGDGFMGVDISFLAPSISSLIPNKDIVCRGEFIVRTQDVEKGVLARSWVNGLVHQKKHKVSDLQKIIFMAYEVIYPEQQTPSEQFNFLQKEGFQVPWNQVVTTLHDDSLKEIYQARRQVSPYSIDGIVVAQNIVAPKDTKGDTVSNPKHKVAFKMTLSDQQATTTVVAIVWSASHQGYWIPRIQIEPVLIGGSRIEFLTGHHAQFVLQNKVGKGAKIIIRKSGDVIPTLEKVLEPGQEIILPEGEWATDVHYKVSSSNDEMMAKKLEHFASVLGIPHLGPGLVQKLIQGGKKTVYDLATIQKEELERIVGKGMAVKIFPALQNSLREASEVMLMVASSTMPRGVGDIKLKALFQAYPNPNIWLSSPLVAPAGWTDTSLQAFLSEFPAYVVWRKQNLPMIPYPVSVKMEKEISKGNGERICFTGFRDAALEKQLEERGHVIVSGVSSKTTVLVVKEITNSEKVKKAQELHIPIFTKEECLRKYIEG